MILNNINTLREIGRTELQEIFDKSTSITDVLKTFGFISQRKDSRKLINSLILSMNIDLTKMHINLKSNMKEIHQTRMFKNTFTFSKGRFVTGWTIIKNMRKIGKEMKCCECGISEEYNGKPLSLQVHHIDGDNTNNLIENLMLLCPNCHSQTDSYCGKKNKKPAKKCTCGSVIHKKSISCRKCSHEYQMLNGRSRRQFEVSKEELEKLVTELPLTQIGIRFGVSDNAVKKRCIKLGIVLKPMRGYWRKLETGNL